MGLQPFVGPWPFFSFLIYTQPLGLFGPARHNALYLHTEQHKQNKHTQISMTQFGFDPTIPVFERENMVHILDSAVTVVDNKGLVNEKFRKNMLTT
jgi:hypothetical protein